MNEISGEQKLAASEFLIFSEKYDLHFRDANESTCLTYESEPPQGHEGLKRIHVANWMMKLTWVAQQPRFAKLSPS